MNMEKEIYPRGNLDVTIQQLMEAERKGEHVFCNFNGHELHSDGITVDSAYKEVTGHTKEEFEQLLNEAIERNERERVQREQKAIENIPTWIERGKEMIFPERYEEWERYVNASARSIYNGLEIEEVLQIMEALDNNPSMDEAINIFDGLNSSGNAEKMIKDTILEFSKRGPEFWLATTDPERISIDNLIIVKKKIQENSEYGSSAHSLTDGPGRHI